MSLYGRYVAWSTSLKPFPRSMLAFTKIGVIMGIIQGIQHGYQMTILSVIIADVLGLITFLVRKHRGVFEDYYGQ